MKFHRCLGVSVPRCDVISGNTSEFRDSLNPWSLLPRTALTSFPSPLAPSALRTFPERFRGARCGEADVALPRAAGDRVVAAQLEEVEVVRQQPLHIACVTLLPTSNWQLTSSVTAPRREPRCAGAGRSLVAGFGDRSRWWRSRAGRPVRARRRTPGCARGSAASGGGKTRP